MSDKINLEYLCRRITKACREELATELIRPDDVRPAFALALKRLEREGKIPVEAPELREVGEVPAAPEFLESWYDAEVAPKLLALGRECSDRGIPLLAVVGYDGAAGASSGRTFCAPVDRADFFNVMDVAARCHTEGGGFHLDAFLGAMIRRARERGHSSAYLRLLGVSEEPATPTNFQGVDLGPDATEAVVRALGSLDERAS